MTNLVPKTWTFFLLPPEIRHKVYDHLSSNGDISDYRYVSKQFWLDLAGYIGRTVPHKLRLSDFANTYFRGSIALQNPPSMLKTKISNEAEHLVHYLIEEHEIGKRSPRLDTWHAIDTDYCKHVRHLDLREYCIYADRVLGRRGPYFTCNLPSEEYGITHLRYAFPSLRTVSCKCATADVVWSSYQSNDSCVNVQDRPREGSCFLIPRRHGFLPMYHNWQIASMSAVLTRHIPSEELQIYRKAVSAHRNYLKTCSGEPGSQKRADFEARLQSELTNALVRCPSSIQAEPYPFGRCYTENYWPSARQLCELVDENEGEVPIFKQKQRSVYRIQMVGQEWKWCFLGEKKLKK